MDPQLSLFEDDDILYTARKPVLIGLSGAAGSGKSLLSSALMQRGWVRVKFADPLKNMLRAFYRTVGVCEGEIERRIEGDLKELPCEYLRFRTPRHAMQTLGQEWGRTEIASNLWVAAWESAVRREFSKGRAVVVDDCRYPNEADIIRKLGGHVVHVMRPGHGFLPASHASEQFDFDPDAIVMNTGPIDEFIEAGTVIIRSLL